MTTERVQPARAITRRASGKGSGIAGTPPSHHSLADCVQEVYLHTTPTVPDELATQNRGVAQKADSESPVLGAYADAMPVADKLATKNRGAAQKAESPVLDAYADAMAGELNVSAGDKAQSDNSQCNVRRRALALKNSETNQGARLTISKPRYEVEK